MNENSNSSRIKDDTKKRENFGRNFATIPAEFFVTETVMSEPLVTRIPPVSSLPALLLLEPRSRGVLDDAATTSTEEEVNDTVGIDHFCRWCTDAANDTRG